jgi:hypothetical protein
MDHLLRAAAALAAAFPTLAPGQDGRTPETAAADLLAAALDAQERGAQAELLARAYELRDLLPGEPAGPFLIGAAHASLGPAFARDVAQYAFRRVLDLMREPLPAAAEQRLLQASAPALASRQRERLTALPANLRAWLADLARGKPLLLAPDRQTLARMAARTERRASEVAAWAAAERAKRDRLRRAKQDAEKALHRERTRKRRPGEGFRDLQPYADRIASLARALAASDRALREHEADLKEVRAEAKRLGTRLAAFDRARGGT